MPIKLGVILLAVIGIAYNIVLNVVRYRSANNPTPENVSDVYDAETYIKWKNYSAEHCRLALASSAVSLIITLILLCADVYAAFASLFGGGMYVQLFAVVLLETVVTTVTGIAESYVSTMVIEEKYGFNRSSMKTFIFDRIRSFALNLILSVLIAALIALLHTWLGAWMILLFALVAFGTTLLISFLYPVLSRIGNKFTPLEDGDLKDKLLALLAKYGYKVKAIEVMDASRRTTKLNAYFTGFGKLKTIVLYDNLIEAMSAEEICAVFAHELGHGLHKDVLKNQIMNIGYLLLMGAMALGIVSLPQLYTSFGFEAVNYGFTYILLGIGLGILQPLVNLAINAQSRAAEYRADRQAVTEGYGEEMVIALKKLAKDNFAHLAPSKINVLLEYSHPPLSRRIEEVEKTTAELKKN